MNDPNSNQKVPLQNNGLDMQMQTQPQFGLSSHQNFPFMPNMQFPMINPPASMNSVTPFLPLQNNQPVMPHMGLSCPTTQQNQFHVGFGPQSSLFPVQGNIMQNPAQTNLSQPQGQLLAQNILNMLQQQNMNVNMPNGQFCAPIPFHNMNQQLAMQISNPSQVVPYVMPPASRPMFGFLNQVPQAMVPQNSAFSANFQLGLVPGNQVGPQVNLNQSNMIPPIANTNAVTSAPFASQQLQGNTYAPLNSNLIHHTKNSQPSGFAKSQAYPSNNIRTNTPKSNWNGSPSKNFKNKPNRGLSQGGFQKSKFRDTNKGRRKFGFPNGHMGKGLINEREGNFGTHFKEQNHEPKRSFSVAYTEQEIQQWREARRKNYPTKENLQKGTERLKDSKVNDREILRRELKDVLAKQAELGVEVAEIPSYYLRNSEKGGIERDEKRALTDKRKFQTKFDRRSSKKGRFSKKQNLADRDFSNSLPLNKRKPTLLQKLFSADIKRDKSHLLQVFRFMVMNSFFKDWPDKPLGYPSVMVKGNEVEGDVQGKYLHTTRDVSEFGNETTVQKLVNINKDNNDDDSEDENGNDDTNHADEYITSHKEASCFIKREFDNEGGVEESDKEEGEIFD